MDGRSSLNLQINKLKIIDELSIKIYHKTKEISKQLSQYNIDNSDPDELFEIISSREKLVNKLHDHQKEFSIEIKKNDVFNLNDLADKRKRINQRIAEIIEEDKLINHKIATFKDTVSQQFVKIKKGIKFTKGYNVFPHRKSIFLDVGAKK